MAGAACLSRRFSYSDFFGLGDNSTVVKGKEFIGFEDDPASGGLFAEELFTILSSSPMVLDALVELLLWVSIVLDDLQMPLDRAPRPVRLALVHPSGRASCLLLMAGDWL